MISKESCDTTDWSNDAKNSALNKLNYTSLHIQIENTCFKL